MKRSLALLTFGFLSLASCKKDDDDNNPTPTPTPTPVCRITLSISVPTSGTDADSTVTTYNNDGSLAKIQTVDETNSDAPTRTYTHTGLSTVAVTARPNGTVTSRDSFVKNAAGYVVYERNYSNPSNLAVWNETVYEYNGSNEVQKSTFRSHTGTVLSTTTYTWSGGNMTSSSISSGTTTNYEYYTDKAYAEGDFLQQLFQQTPGKLLANKNLFKSASSGGSPVATANYTMDTEGKITRMDYTFGALAGRNDYSYTCK